VTRNHAASLISDQLFARGNSLVAASEAIKRCAMWKYADPNRRTYCTIGEVGRRNNCGHDIKVCALLITKVCAV
jgi:hypothetical protein